MKKQTKELYFKQLAIKSQNNDTQAYQQLLLDLSCILRAFIYKHCFNHNQVEDILQETLLGIHKALHTYNPKYSFTTWCFAICRYKLIDNLKKEQKISEREIKNDEFIVTFCSQEHNKEEELSEQLDQALATLAEPQKSVVTLLKIKGYSIKETASELKISTANVKIIAHRAYKKLREILNEKN